TTRRPSSPTTRSATSGPSWRSSNESPPFHGGAGRARLLRRGDGARPRAHPRRALRPGPHRRARLPLRDRDAGDAHHRHPLLEHDVLRGGAADRALRLRELHGARQVPAARRGDRMTQPPFWIEVVVAVLVLASSFLVLTAAVGLVRLKTFFL